MTETPALLCVPSLPRGVGNLLRSCWCKSRMYKSFASGSVRHTSVIDFITISSFLYRFNLFDLCFDFMLEHFVFRIFVERREIKREENHVTNESLIVFDETMFRFDSSVFPINRNRAIVFLKLWYKTYVRSSCHECKLHFSFDIESLSKRACDSMLKRLFK